MHKLFENLLISSPNGGGLFFSRGGEVFGLDALSTTGFFYHRDIVLRGFQPNNLCIYDNLAHLISGESANFNDVHDVLWEGGYCYLVGTVGNEIIKLSRRGDELQRWVFPGDRDSWHINCLGSWSGRIVFSAFGDFREHRGYKGKSLGMGFVQDLLSGERLISGLSQPHSLVAVEDRLFLANSEQRELIEFSEDGNILRSKQLDGYPRGIFVLENAIYVGLSCSRNIEFEGITSATVIALDLETLEELGRLQIPAKEIYAIQHVSDRDDFARVLAIIGATSSAMLKESLDKHVAQIASLSQVVTERDGQIASLSQVVTERDGQIASLSQAVTERDGQIASLSQVVTERDGQIASLSQAVTERDGQIASLSQAVTERDGQIASLSQAVTERDGQIVSLSQAVTERDGQIASLSQAVTERDGQIASLSQAVTERDGQIASLSQAVTERDGQIASLSQAVTERDGQIASLSQAVTERDGQIASLSQAVTERDGQIASLSQAVTERDGQIASLSQAVTERDGQIASLTDETVRRGVWALGLDAELKEERAKVFALTTSHSWRITRPLREARRWISSPNAQAKRYAKSGLRFAKRIYQSFPLSLQTKAKHRQWIAKVAPRVLLATGAHPSTIPVLIIPPPLTGKVTIQAESQAIENQNIHAAGISIFASDNPLVSVIIPIYGKVDYTLRCLASVAAHPPFVEFEVIVVDDCSPDDSLDALNQKVKGIRVLRNERNQGFIRSCNIGAKAAKGQYLYFLNNDTEVTEGWADSLLRTFSDFPGTGLAGSKLVYPDGRLQEAGGIIWQDGSAWNFGRYQDPQLPVYNYAREVDYCSGASIMVPKSLFEELGGFDERYLPAYCEDSDLALKIRDKRHRVIYQPLSTVIHYEGITSGTDTTQGAKAYQVENSKKLFERWKQLLQFHQAPGNDVDNAKDRRATRRVLVLDHCTPTPNQDAGSVTVFNLLLLLREMDFQVTFIPEDNFLYVPEYTTALQRNGIEVLYAPFFISVEQHLKEQGARYELAFMFRPGVIERHLNAIKKHCPKSKVLYHTVDLHFLRMAREAELQKDKAKERLAQEMQQRELAAIQAADASIVHSTAELELLRPMLPEAKLHVFPLIMDVKGTTKRFSERRDIVFVGGYQHTPNVDAVQHFVKGIMPLLREQLPGVRFYAVGSKPPEEIKALACEDIIITGFVEDLNPLLDKMRVSVAPLRYGAGIKGKIGIAMAAGLPVVATPMAAEGMSLTDGENILVADGTDAFVNAVVRIYRDEALWRSISRNGLAFADNAWGAVAAWGILATILADMGIQVKRSALPLSLYSELPPHTTRGQHKILRPIGLAKSRQEYLELLENPSLQKISQIEKQLLVQANSEAFAVDGFCVPCDKKVSFLVDMQSGG